MQGRSAQHAWSVLPKPAYSAASTTAATSAVVAASAAVTARDRALSEDGVSVDEVALPNSRVALHVTLPGARTKRAWQRALRKVGTSISVPGFRKGKQIPEDVIFQHTNKESVIREALASLLNSSLAEVTEAYRTRAYADSLKMDSTTEELVSAFRSGQPLGYRLSFDIQPQLVWRGDYTKLKVEAERAGTEESDREVVEMGIRKALKERGRLRIVSGRGLAAGDVALVDFEARLAASGEPIAGSKREGLQIDTGEPHNSIGIPGLATDMEGMSAGESKTSRQVIPDTWWEASIRGSDIECDIRLRELFTWDLPELTDELAVQLAPACGGVAGLRASLAETQAKISAEATADAVNHALTAAVAAIVEVDVPEAMIREAAVNEYQAQLLEMQSGGRLDMEMINQLATDEMLDKFIETRREELTQLQRGVLGFEAIFEAEGMSVGREEVEAEAARALGEAAGAGEDLDRERLELQVFEVLKAMKVLQFLTDKSEIELKPPTRVQTV